MSRVTFVRQPLAQVTARYDHLARWYRYLELTVLLVPGFRRRAITRIRLQPGETVLEVGCGTGRNLALLRAAVGPSGCVIGLDASPGMLAEAAKTVSRHGWANVRLIEADAATLALERHVDAAYFSLSYSAIPDRPAVLDTIWQAVRPGGRLVIMDAGLPDNRLGRILGPFAEVIATAFPGDPYSEPWSDLERLSTPVRTERFMSGIYFVCAIDKAG